MMNSKKLILKWTIATILGAILVVFLTEAIVYCDALALVNDYEAKCKTVNDLEDLLSTQNLTIGSGLEAMDLKIKLGDAIEERNIAERDINNWLDCPYVWHKEVFDGVL